MRSAERSETDGGGPDPDALLEDSETFDAATSGDASATPLAVVGAPFAGRETVLDAAAERLGGERVSLSPDRDHLPDRIGDGPLVVDGCHHLYQRTVGGFDRLDAFLDRLADAEHPVVTGWNRYAWAYLAAVRGVDRAVAARVDVGPVATETIAAVVLSRYGELPQFAVEADGDDRFGLRWRRIGVGGYGVSVPVPTVRDTGGEVDPKDVVFERLAAVSAGNLGVATAIWATARAEEMRPSDIVGAGTDPDLDRDEAFCLRLVLAKERVTRSELTAVVGDGADRVVGRLARAGLVERDGDLVCLDPAAVPTATAATDRRPIL